MPDLALSLAALLPHSAGPYIGMVLAGFAIGILGHLAGSRGWSRSAWSLIFLGAFLFPSSLNLTETTPPQVENTR